MAEACRKIDADFREGAARLVRETGRPVGGRHRVRHRRGQTLPRLDAGRGLAPGARFSLSEHHDAELAYGALAVRGGAVPGVIMHTDQGSKYTVRLFRVACERLPIRQSMGRPGSPHQRDDRVLAFHRGMGAAVQGHLRDQCPATDGDRGVDRGLQHQATAFGLRRDAPGRLGAGLRRRAGYGVAPPALRVLRIALRATALRAALDPGDLGRPWRQEERTGPGPSPGHTRGAQPPRWRACARTCTPGKASELAFR
jgi:hypothetical protein